MPKEKTVKIKLPKTIIHGKKTMVKKPGKIAAPKVTPKKTSSQKHLQGVLLQTALLSRKVKLFLKLTFSLSWGLAGIFYAFGGRLNQPLALPIMLLYMWMPAISAIIVQKFIFHEPLRNLGINFKPNKWWLAAWLIPPVLAFLTMGINILLPGIKFSPDMAGMFERYKSVLTAEQIKQMKDSIKALPVHPVWLALIQGLIAGVTVNAIAAFGEELGWRGLLFVETRLPRADRGRGVSLCFKNFWKTSLFIGAVWGLWHAPIIIQGYNYPQHPILGVLLMTLWTILLTPWMLFLRIKSQSVINSAIFHGTINGTAGIAILLILGGNDLTTGILGLPGFIALGIANLILYFIIRLNKN